MDLFKKVRLLSLSFLLLEGTSISGIAADPPQEKPTPPAASVTDQVMARRRRLEEFQSLLKDPNLTTRQAALQQALQDTDPVIRGGAIAAYLKRFDALLPEVQLEKDSQVPPEEVPRLAIVNLVWSADGTSAVGVYSSTCGAFSVRMQVAGGKLAIAYDGVCIRPSLLGIDTGGDSKKAAQAVGTGCQLTLTPNADDMSLNGPLHCVGMATVLPVQLPFGP